MYCISKRLAALVSHTFSFTTVLLVMIFILSHINKKEIPECNIVIGSHALDSSRTRYIYFSPNIDLSPQFHLNVKQIFVYLKMDYEGTNSDMLWSTIVRRGADKKLHEYYYNNYSIPIVKPGKMHLELRGCVFPYIGQTSDVLYARQVLSVK